MQVLARARLALYPDADYYYFCPQTYILQVKNWAYQIGRVQLSDVSTASFIGHQLERISLPELAASLLSNAKEVLIVSPALLPQY